MAWTMAVSVVFLILQGLEMHFNGSFNIFGFDKV
jgi:cytochrome b subunit of formate dehydrogenase